MKANPKLLDLYQKVMKIILIEKYPIFYIIDFFSKNYKIKIQIWALESI